MGFLFWASSRDNGKSLVRNRGTLLRTLSAADSSAYDHESILDDVDGSIHASVSGYREKFFEGKSWSSDCHKIVSSVDLDNFKARSLTIESPIALCLLLQEVLKLDERGVVYCPVQTPPTQPPSHRSGGIALFSAIKESEPRAEVVGVFRPGEASDYKDGFFELCGHARAVFSRRPDRLFVHGFYIFGNIMECWNFDRSGMYGCEPFDAIEYPERFLTIMSAYAFMGDQEWGRSNFIKEDCEGTYVCVQDDNNKVTGKMYLQTPPFVARDDEVIARGSLLCHRGRESANAQWRFVVKYKWKPPWHEPEAKQLKKARDRNVWGVVQFHSYQVIDNTENLRSGLIFGPPQQLKDTEAVEQTAESGKMSAAVIGARALLETFEENRPNLPKSPGYRNSPKGMLIDFDTAWDTARGPTPQGSMVGTSPFMAIGALEAHVPNNPRTYRHDLESFFYVFLFIAICPREEDSTKTEELPETSRLLQWRQDKRKQVRKTADMGEERFEAILEEFSPEFSCLKELARKLRGVLFPLKDGKIWTWTDMSPEGTDKLYDDMTGAFEDALDCVPISAKSPYPTTSLVAETKAPSSNLPFLWWWLPKKKK
ncbi:hypothetical protein ACLOAV_000061 [Pseudogymnoascus australis]